MTAALVVASGPGEARADVAGEWSGPKDAPAGVLLIHGGVWLYGGPDHVAALAPQARRYAAQGARVLNADHRPFDYALGDVLNAYDALDAQVDGPICTAGDSSGGHLALVIAIHRPVACVLARAAPTDLPALDADGAPNIATAAIYTFGSPAGALAASPLQFAPQLAGIPVLLSGLEDDTVVPFVQQTRLAAALPDSQLATLKRGGAPFIHGHADADQVDALQVREHRIVAAATGLPAYVPPSVRPPVKPPADPPGAVPEPLPPPPAREPPPLVERPAPPPSPPPPAFTRSKTLSTPYGTIARHGLLVRRRVHVPAIVSWRLEAVRRGRRPLVLATATRMTTAAGVAGARLRLNRRDRRLARVRRGATLRLRVRVVPLPAAR